MEVCNFEIAIKLKEKGFDELCLLHYTNEQILVQNSTQSTIGNTIGVDDMLDSYNRFNNDYTDAPTISQVLKWLRETKNVEVVASFSYSDKVWGYQVGDMTLSEDSILSYDYSFPTYEAAAISGIEYVVNNLI